MCRLSKIIRPCRSASNLTPSPTHPRTPARPPAHTPTYVHCAGRYAEVYAVFNNRNLWVNMQWREENNVNVMNRDPARITYNMGLPGTENEWLPFVTSERGGGSIVPCYIPRSLSARLPQDQVREMEERALEELVSGLENVRSVVNATTVLANESSPGMVKYVACVPSLTVLFEGFACNHDTGISARG